mgnify:CR=1 FL=1
MPSPPLAEVGIEVKFKGLRYPVLIGATHVLEMNAIEVGGRMGGWAPLFGTIAHGRGARRLACASATRHDTLSL